MAFKYALSQMLLAGDECLYHRGGFSRWLSHFIQDKSSLLISDSTSISQDTELTRQLVPFSTRSETVSPTLAPVERPQSQPPSDLKQVLSRLGPGDIIFASISSILQDPELKRFASLCVTAQGPT